ncbi:MAG: deoxyribose-phosphate aldolase, partial [Terracidiphilus sp.]
MTAITPIGEADLEFDHGSFDSAAFARQTLESWQALAGIIDHTLLKPEATREQVESLCDEAIRYRFACAMVNPIWASTAVGMLSGTGVPVGVVIGFPLGASLVSTLRQEAAALVRLGARELDMVIPIGQLKSGNHHAVAHAIHAAASVAHHHGALLKVILETSLLTVEEKLRGAELAIQAGADFLKTSTGFASGGATAADVALLRGVAGARCGIKA